MNYIGQYSQSFSESSQDSKLLKFMDISPEVAEAKKRNLPVVALESTFISYGIDYPHNKTTAIEVETIIRKGGAIPATIAIIDGRVKIGLNENELEKLSKLGNKVSKCSRRDLAYFIMKKESANCTVAATLLLAKLAGIRVFVTGGIGGVHREADQTFDISADLVELSHTPVAVICSGCKAILDIPKTLEVLETLGVAVVGYKTDKFPEYFFSEGSCKVSSVVDNIKECAELIKTTFYDIELKNGIVVANPIPKEEEADPLKVREYIEKALVEAKEKNIVGSEVTPFLLKRVNEMSGGDSQKSNIALIKNNADIGAKIASELHFSLSFSR